MKPLRLVPASLLLVATILLAAGDEKRGSFNVLLNENYLKFDYTLTFLGHQHKQGYAAFRFQLLDDQGLDLHSSIEEPKTFLKIRTKALAGTIEPEGGTSVIILFPWEDQDPLEGKVQFNTTVFEYKLKKDLRL